MAEGNKNLLDTLISLSKVDGRLASIKAERLKLENELATLQSQIKKLTADHQNKAKIHADKRTRYDREEKQLRDESEKLVSRRKALQTLGAYKLQQAAEKEIDIASRQISTREEALLKSMEEVDAQGKDAERVKAALDSAIKAYEKLRVECDATFVNLEERQSRNMAEREKYAALIDSANLKLYERIRDKFPMDAVVPLRDTNCSGCFMQLGPQVVVQISRGDSLVRCRGCGRILHMQTAEESKEE